MFHMSIYCNHESFFSTFHKVATATTVHVNFDTAWN